MHLNNFSGVRDSVVGPMRITNENPRVAELLKNTQSIRVINSIRVKDITGNCRGCKRKSYEPLKKQRRHRSN